MGFSECPKCGNVWSVTDTGDGYECTECGWNENDEEGI